METTTELTLIRNASYKYTWGRVKKIHDFGPMLEDGITYTYTLVEHYSRKLNSKEHEETTSFSVYVDGKSQNVSSKTFEGAAVLAFSCKLNGYGSAAFNAGHYAMKVLRPEHTLQTID